MAQSQQDTGKGRPCLQRGTCVSSKDNGFSSLPVDTRDTLFLRSRGTFSPQSSLDDLDSVGTKSKSELLNRKDANDSTLLHYAAEMGNDELFLYLRSQGLNPKATNNYQETVLHRACLFGQRMMCHFLTGKYPRLREKVDIYGRSPLHHCAAGGDTTIFEMLVEQGMDAKILSKRSENVLHLACSRGQFEMAQYLDRKYPEMKKGLDQNGWSVLHHAACGGNMELFDMLLDKCSDLLGSVIDLQFVLFVACKKACFEIVKSIAESHPDALGKVNAMKMTALHQSAVGGNLEIFKFILENGINVNSVTVDGKTVLHKASRRGNLALVEYLVKTFPNLKQIMDIEDNSALHYAARSGSVDVFQLLVSEGCDVSRFNINGQSVLHQACKYGQHEMVEHITAKYSGTTNFFKFTDLRGTQSCRSTATSGYGSFVSSSHSRMEPVTPTKSPICGFSLPYTSAASFDEPEFGNNGVEGTDYAQQCREGKLQLLQWIFSRVDPSFPSAKYMWAGYDPKSRSEPIVVAIGDEKPKSVDSHTYRVEFRKPDEVSEEAKIIAEMEISKGLSFSAEESESLRKCLKRHSSRLMKEHSNLEIVSTSKIKSSKYGKERANIEQKACVVLYCRVKGIVPFGEELFPKELDGFPVDVREGYFEPFSDPPGFHRNLVMGCGITTAYGTSGTLGGFVKLENGNTACLTCWHVFLSPEIEADLERNKGKHLQIDVFQPDKSSSPFKFGELKRWEMDKGDERNIGVDVAAIEITDSSRHPVSGEVVDGTHGKGRPSLMYKSGKIVTDFQELPSETEVVKYGSRTGYTKGFIRSSATAVRTCKFHYTVHGNVTKEYELHQQFEVYATEGYGFSEAGDSGSLVFPVKLPGTTDVRALGMLVGGTSYNSTIVTPIWAVLQKLDLPQELLPFDKRTASVGTEADLLDVSSQEMSDMACLKQEVSSLKEGMARLEESVGKKISGIEENVGRKIGQLDDKISSILDFLSKK